MVEDGGRNRSRFEKKRQVEKSVGLKNIRVEDIEEYPNRLIVNNQFYQGS